MKRPLECHIEEENEGEEEGGGGGKGQLYWKRLNSLFLRYYTPGKAQLSSTIV